jgi:hypothetical protein
MADININPNFDSSFAPNSYFRHQQEFSADKLLYDSLVAESYNKMGVPATFYNTSVNFSDYNDIFGEDIDVNVNRSFNIMISLELPEYEEIFSKYGIENLDAPIAYCSIAAFKKSSEYQLSGTEYISGFAPVTPKAGDIVKPTYSGTFYKIVNVKVEQNQFLQSNHSYRFTMKVMGDEHMTVDPTLSGDSISTLMDIPDIFSISGAIEREKVDVLFDGSQEKPIDNPFSEWG